MKKYVKYAASALLLIVLWLIPLLVDGFSADGLFIRAAVSNVVFLLAAVLSRAVPNRHVALASALSVGVAFCVVQPAAVFDALPALLLCCLLRCNIEKEKGNYSAVWFEVLTDLIYLSLAASAVRLIRSGYTFMTINAGDLRTIPDVFLLVLVLLAFVGLFVFNAGASRTEPARKQGRKKSGRAERGIVGIIPVYTTLRTFFGLCAVALAVSLLTYTNGSLIEELNVYARAGLRFLSFPWIVLVFLSADALAPDSKRFKARTENTQGRK